MEVKMKEFEEWREAWGRLVMICCARGCFISQGGHPETKPETKLTPDAGTGALNTPQSTLIAIVAGQRLDMTSITH